MKKLIYSLCVTLMLAVTGCKYDDSELSGRVDNLEDRVTTLEQMCQQMNTNISSLQTIVNAMQGNDFITSVEPLTENGVEVGYTIKFDKSPEINIYHGKDGQNGTDGANGSDGKDGKDGYTPKIGISQDQTDGLYYWTLDGDWLLNDNGEKVLAQGLPGADGEDGKDGADGKDGKDGVNGQDGVTPQFKIDNGDWYISLDEGKTWEYVGQATGADGNDGQDGLDGNNGTNGKDGDSIFSKVDTDNKDYVVFTLTDGTELQVPRYALKITFTNSTNGTELAVTPGEEIELEYEVSGATGDIVVEVLSTGNVKAKAEADTEDPSKGTITISVGSTIDEYDRVIVLVSDGERVIMSSLTFEEFELNITDSETGETPEYKVEADSNELAITVSTNAEYEVAIPEDAKEWISYVETRSVREETIVLQIAENNTDSERKADVTLVNRLNNNLITTIPVTQEASPLAILEDTEKAFPDPIFRAYVLENFDTDGDGRISKQEALQVKNIKVNSRKIKSLEGIRYFENLDSLICYNNLLTDLDVSKNTALTYIDCLYNQLTSLDVSNNKELTYLNCYSMQLTSLNVSNNTALTYLYCGSNQLTSLNVSNNTALTYLDCANNQLTSLNVSNNTALTYLYCGANQLTSLNVSKNTALTSLECDNNQLTSLDVSKNTALTYLNCANNQLTSLDVFNNTALTDLRCYSNQLTSLDVSKNTALTGLECYNNQLTSLDVSNNTALTYLFCESNQLTSLDVSNNTALTDLWCYSNQLTSLDVSNNTALTSLDCKYNQLTSLDVSKNTALTSLDCDNNQLTSLDVSKNIALKWLNCRKNQLTSLDLTNNPNLTNLQCDENVTVIR